MANRFPIRRIDHIEFHVGNARQAAAFYQHAFGLHVTAYRGLETGCRETTSYVLECETIRFVLTSGLAPGNAAARFAHAHGDGVAVVALEVPDAAHAFAEAQRHGAVGAAEPAEERDGQGLFRSAAIHAYGDTVIRFVERHGYDGVFAPGFEPRTGPEPTGADAGLTAIDHVVANVERGQMDRWVQFFTETMGFSELLHFDDEAISTEYSALMSKVMQDGTGRIKFPINEPATGRRKSQVAEYLDYFGGPGVQHIAFATDDIVETVSRMRARGMTFLSVPAAYYDDLPARVPAIGPYTGVLAGLGILADRDEDGYLLQIFTEPVQDRPTVFFEVIERRGSKGFGQGNFKSLFEAIEREQSRRGNLVEAAAS
ncbi:MAG: 4-hydroxyphenylpyruvate dioxygenase [Acidobacteria bacterium]|nr:4-hydroxyphenylpyruvate dioxygenase [Acidobacteriota bacterium]